MEADSYLQELSKSELIEYCSRVKESRDRVFSIVSHDLRSPFSGLLGLSDMIVTDFDNIDRSELKEFLETMLESLKNTYNMLENLFEWGQIERAQYVKRVEMIPLGIVVEEVVQELGKLVSGKDMQIVYLFNSEEIVRTNSRMLEFVLRNFVSNAAKFSNRGGRIEVDCKTHGAGTIISVRDYGIGITEENMDKLFMPSVNWRIHGTEGECGTGLGLLAANRYAESFGAEIKVESVPGSGSTFSLILSEAPV